jgi:hypothetical protein
MVDSDKVAAVVTVAVPGMVPGHAVPGLAVDLGKFADPGMVDDLDGTAVLHVAVDRDMIVVLDMAVDLDVAASWRDKRNCAAMGCQSAILVAPPLR